MKKPSGVVLAALEGAQTRLEKAQLLGSVPRHPDHEPEHDPAAAAADGAAAADRRARQLMLWMADMSQYLVTLE